MGYKAPSAMVFSDFLDPRARQPERRRKRPRSIAYTQDRATYREQQSGQR